MPKPYLAYQGIKFENGSEIKVSDPITIEKALQISINSKPFTVVMQTPGDEVLLAKGLLFSEDVIGKKSQYKINTLVDEDGFIKEVDVIIDEKELGEGFLSSRSLLSVSSCGICGKQSLDDFNFEGKGNKISFEWYPAFIFDLQSKMQKSQLIFPHTGSTHCSTLFDEKGNLLSSKEDIGRHNALDKAIGDLIEKNNLDKAKILFFSGRLSFEIIFKSFRAKIPAIVAISAPSSLAIDYAKEFGISIAGFCRNNKFTVYNI